MLRHLALAAAFATSSLLVAGAAYAQPTNAYYSATPASAPTAGRTMIRGQVWTCDGQSCTAGQGESRPAIICAVAARELGQLTAFTANGVALDSANLDKCNARAK